MRYYAEVENNGNTRNWFDWDDEKYPEIPNLGKEITIVNITSLPEEKRALIGFKYNEKLKQFKKEAVLDSENNVIQEEVIVTV